MAKITYVDKETLYENTQIPAHQKVQSGDMNEIKRVVNQNDDSLGKLNNLETTEKTNLVGAVNELVPFVTSDGSYGSARIGKIAIEWGIITIAPTNGYGTSQVNFRNDFKNEPLVVACAGVGTSSINNVGAFGVTKSSASIFMTTPANQSTSRNCRYFIFGEIE